MTLLDALPYTKPAPHSYLQNWRGAASRYARGVSGPASPASLTRASGSAPSFAAFPGPDDPRAVRHATHVRHHVPAHSLSANTSVRYQDIRRAGHACAKRGGTISQSGADTRETRAPSAGIAGAGEPGCPPGAPEGLATRRAAANAPATAGCEGLAR